MPANIGAFSDEEWLAGPNQRVSVDPVPPKTQPFLFPPIGATSRRVRFESHPLPQPRRTVQAGKQGDAPDLRPRAGTCAALPSGVSAIRPVLALSRLSGDFPTRPHQSRDVPRAAEGCAKPRAMHGTEWLRARAPRTNLAQQPRLNRATPRPLDPQARRGRSAKRPRRQ